MKATSKTIAGNFIRKSEIQTEEVISSVRKVMQIWLYPLTTCVVEREIYFNARLWFRGVSLYVGSRGSPICGFAECDYYLPVYGSAGLA
jgi:hypothetical protein